ncbi:hypothetical protein BJ170DRAFT_680733 [Xylariales sp. AK1849]|nr:hypothetical protein BJ170DRAFT_680733 [Xylariales sp. AK1849]
MAPRYDEAPEVTPQAYPEVHHPPAVPEVASYNEQYHQIPQTPVKQQDSALHSGVHAPTHPAPPQYGYDQQSAYGGTHSSGRQSKKATICGCSLLIFILSIIIALLSAAVIGLAAGTGVEASRANDAETKLAALDAGGSISTVTTTVTAAASAATNFNSIDRNCTSNAGSITGSNYSSLFFNKATYTVYCNKDTVNAPLQSLFVANFDDCMDACSSFSSYMTSDFSSGSSLNQTCAGVSFIPAWTNRTFAELGQAPGNCYLKPGPQNETSLYAPSSGSETHAAIVDGS